MLFNVLGLNMGREVNQVIREYLMEEKPRLKLVNAKVLK